MSGYGEIIKKGRATEKEEKSQQEVNTESGKTIKHDSGNDPVNITIKVPRRMRQYWTSQCKLEGVTMTEVLTQALEQRFGVPD